MKFKYGNGILKFDKELSELDKQVIKFIKLIKKSGTRYVLVSGYVAILFGRSRTTEDIDLFINKIDYGTFQKLFNRMVDDGYWAVDSDSLDDAFSRLQEGLSIRMAKNDTVIPNFEIKFAKKTTDFISLDRPLKVIVNNNELLMSPLEIQIPFKVWLGSEKDIEDAAHLYELFGKLLDKKLMADMSKRLKVERKMVKYGFK